ncbi:nucleic acid-binding protein [Aspergillus recurvatus]
MSAFTSALRSTLRAAPSAAASARSFSSSSSRAMARMNITGRLGATPEVATTQNGIEYVKYNVASESGPSNNRVTSWFNVKAFVSDGQREYLSNLPKGTLVSVDADASLRKFQNSEGVETTSLSLHQRNIEILRRPFKPNQSESESQFESQQ